MIWKCPRQCGLDEKHKWQVKLDQDGVMAPLPLSQVVERQIPQFQGVTEGK